MTRLKRAILPLVGLLVVVGCGDDEPDQATVGGGGGQAQGGSGGSGAAGGGGAAGGQGGSSPGPCGDGELSESEDCEDRNRKSHDGCSSGCTIEVLDWRRIEPESSPTIRADHAMAYDPSRDRVLLHGGYFMGALDTTWEYDGTNWAASAPGTVPTARYDHRLAYLAGPTTTVMYGGVTSGLTGLAETWVFDGSNWTLADAASPPGGRYKHGMVFDSDRSTVVMFGGTHLGSPLADTWELDPGILTWTSPTVTDPPSARFGHAMSYDATNDRVVLFGGYDGSTAYGDTYEYDAPTQTWIAISPTTAPSARRFHHMAYDESRQVTVLFGGYDGEELADTWEYVNGEWTETTTTSSVPRGGPITYDTRRRRIVMTSTPIGGATVQTWVYEVTSAWPDEVCTASEDADEDGLAACDDPDCEGLPCEGGTCNAGSCE